MAAWHYDLFLVAAKDVDLEALRARLSRELQPLDSPSPKLLMWGTAEGDRIDFWTDHQPAQLLARLDVRTPSATFRRLLLELASAFSLHLLNADDVEIAATDEALLADIRSSPAQAAATSPAADDDGETEGPSGGLDEP